MEERLNSLKKLLQENLDNSYSDQYGIADFVEGNEKLSAWMDKLSAESEFYQNMLRQISAFVLKN